MDDELVTVAWLKEMGFRFNRLGMYKSKLSKPITVPGLPARAYLCVSTFEFEHEIHPFLTDRNGSCFLYCFPRKRITRGEVIKLIEAFAGR